jgi:hypothetical protein
MTLPLTSIRVASVCVAALKQFEKRSYAMKFAKSLLIGTSSVVLAGFLLTLLAPKALRAVAATLVQVANTASNPAITQDTSRQASQIVTLSCVTGGVCLQVNANSQYTVGAQYYVPSGQNLVITSIEYTTGSAPYQGGVQGYIELTAVNPVPCSYPCFAGIFEQFFVTSGGSTAGISGNINTSPGIVIGATLGPAILLNASFTSVSVYLHGYLTAS